LSQPAYGSPSGLPITLTFTLHINDYDVNLSFSVLFLYKTAGFHTEDAAGKNIYGKMLIF
jgi:hypothetical protein